MINVTDLDAFKEQCRADSCAWEKKQAKVHKGQKSERILTPNQNYIGSLGQFTIGKVMGWKNDKKVKRKGDGGVDFDVDGVWIDIKTSTGVPKLLVKTSCLNSGLYIAMFYSYDDDWVVPKGFATRSEMLINDPEMTSQKYRIWNYWRHYDDLRPMSQLYEKYPPKLNPEQIFS